MSMSITPQQAHEILATVTLTPNEADQIAALLTRQQADLDLCRAAGFIDAEGKVRTVLGTLPLTADGFVIGIDGSVWIDRSDLKDGFVVEIVGQHWTSQWRTLRPSCYSTRATAESAKGGSRG